MSKLRVSVEKRCLTFWLIVSVAILCTPSSSAAGPPPMVLTIDPKLPWNETGLLLQAGRRYRFVAVAGKDAFGKDYSDKEIRCSPDGPIGARGKIFDFFARNPRCWLNPVRWFGPGKIKRLRVLRDRTGQRASFMTVVGAIGMDDSEQNALVIGSGRQLVGHSTGPLYLFSNDWPGGNGSIGHFRFDGSKTYPNNSGKVQVTVEFLD